MSTADVIALAALVVLITISLAAAIIYLAIVARRRWDTFTWAVLGLLAALAATNVPGIFVVIERPFPVLVGASLRLAAALAVFRLLCDLIVQARATLTSQRKNPNMAGNAELADAPQGVTRGNVEE